MIMKCPGCGEEVSKKDKICSKCGMKLPYKKSRLKWKIIGIIGSIVILITMFFYNEFIYEKNLEATQAIYQIEAGQEIDINTLCRANSEKAEIVVDASNVNINRVGVYGLEYTVNFKNRSQTYSGEIEVVDTTPPVIEGEDYICVKQGDVISWKDYFSINDVEVILPDNINARQEVNTNRKGKTSITLYVEDSSGNIGEKEVQIEVIVPTDEELAAIKSIQYLLSSGGLKKNQVNKNYIKKIVCYDAGNKSYFVGINDQYVYANLNKDLLLDMALGAIIYGWTEDVYEGVIDMLDVIGTKQDVERVLLFFDEK